MKNDESVFKFTEELSEFLSAGVELSEALKNCSGKIASEIYKRVFDGEKFSLVLASCHSASFSDVYVGFVSAAENGGNLPKTFEYLLSMLLEKKKSKEKFISAVFYPLLVSVLVFACGGIAIFSFSRILSFDENFVREALKSCLYGGFFFFSVVSLFIFVIKKISEPDLCASFFKSMSFLTENGVPLLNALDCSSTIVASDTELSLALMHIRFDLLGGTKLSDAFSTSLMDAGFPYESKLALSNLSISEKIGKNDSFSKISAAIGKRREKFRTFILAMEQPVLLCACAVFMILVLKDTVIKGIFLGEAGI